MSISLKLTVFLLIQTAGTLAAIAGYYAWLGHEIRTFHRVFSVLTKQADSLHRTLDTPAPLGAAGRETFRTFTVQIDSATAALTRGGEVQGIRCSSIPQELSGLFGEIVGRWELARPALLQVAGSSIAAENKARDQLHAVFPLWQSELSRMQRSLVRREGTIHAQMRNTFALIGGVNLIFLCVVLWLSRRFITQPVRALQAAATRVASGDYSTTAPVSGSDEISSLATEFNRMNAQLQSTIGALRDSEQKLTEKADALEKTNRELEQYAYAAAHDLQEPVRTLSLYVQLLKRRCNLPPEAEQFAEQIHSSAARMQRLVADLLVHSRSVHEVTPSRPADADRAARAAIADLGDRISATGAVIRVHSLPVVMADDPDLTLVFKNLIANALQYSGGKAPEIEISAAVAGGECTVSVRDNGIGIHPEYHSRVFGLFKRLHGPDIPGTGVGLAVTKNLIEKHGGRIWVDSQPGRGATFSFQLRVAAESGSTTAAA